MQTSSEDTQLNGRSSQSPDVRNASPWARFFILRTVFAILFSLLLIFGGVLGYFSLEKQATPDIEIAVANITTTWVGADPQTIEQQVTDEIEAEISSVENIEEIRSASYSGLSFINVEFTTDANIDQSIQELREAVSQAEPELPEEAEQPLVEQVSINEAPILTVALYGQLDAIVLNRAAERIQDRLEQVPGVSEVNLGGARDEVIQVQMNPSRLTALAIAPTTVANEIRNANEDLPLGEIESELIGSQVRFYGRFRTLEDLRELPVARQGERVVRLAEVASVRRELEQEETRAFIATRGENYQPVITVGVTKVMGQDSIEVINNVLAELEEAQQSSPDWPYGLQYRIIADDSDIIWEQLSNLFVNALQAMAAVFVILFIALSWREALIAGLSIPLTFLGALAVLWLFGQTLNNMVLIGMVLSLGILVDVFILMMEGMHEAIFIRGLNFNQSALRTVRTYAPPAFAGQLTTILALVPLMAISGTLGKFIRLLPITAIICLLLSFAIAILVDIPLSRYLLPKNRGSDKKSRIDRISEAASERLTRWSLNYSVRNRATASAWVIGTIVLFLFAIYGFTQLPVTFFPAADTRTFSVNVELPPTTTLEVSQAVADDLGEVLREKDYLESVIKYAGRRSTIVAPSELQPTEGSYLVGFSGVFVPEEERDRLSFEYLDDLRNELQRAIAQYPGASLVVNTQQPGQTGDPIQIEITGENIEQLRQISREIQQMNHYQQAGMPVRKAAANGVAERLRPVLTTSITTIVGLTPLALSEPTWLPLCSAIIFGLMAATAIALVVVPSLYLLLTPKQKG